MSENEFVDYLSEVFEQFAPITARKMFGGHGIYAHGVMFALVAENTLYLKADAENVSAFVQRGLAQFTYAQKGKPVKMSYYLAPEEILEDRAQAAEWARHAYAAACRAQQSKGNPKKSKDKI